MPVTVLPQQPGVFDQLVRGVLAGQQVAQTASEIKNRKELLKIRQQEQELAERIEAREQQKFVAEQSQEQATQRRMLEAAGFGPEASLFINGVDPGQAAQQAVNTGSPFGAMETFGRAALGPQAVQAAESKLAAGEVEGASPTIQAEAARRRGLTSLAQGIETDTANERIRGRMIGRLDAALPEPLKEMGVTAEGMIDLMQALGPQTAVAALGGTFAKLEEVLNPSERTQMEMKLGRLNVDLVATKLQEAKLALESVRGAPERWLQVASEFGFDPTVAEAIAGDPTLAREMIGVVGQRYKTPEDFVQEWTTKMLTLQLPDGTMLFDNVDAAATAAEIALGRPLLQTERFTADVTGAVARFRAQNPKPSKRLRDQAAQELVTRLSNKYGAAVSPQQIDEVVTGFLSDDKYKIPASVSRELSVPMDIYQLLGAVVQAVGGVPVEGAANILKQQQFLP